MEAHPERKQENLNRFHLLVVSLIMILAFFFISMVTNNFNYTVASVVTVLVINFSIIKKSIRP
ncbi:hypothetical protein SAMN04487936_10984 [Halobacillus dabanensis]|uniref:Uncharacterized protein n=1 Tax=Halobacillus dabanensis TaxID=240302 RepID=A0A1I3XQU1_HALDA|nr:hypothetical protein [Halobacillus dabanensis]SFK21888.1 hypothetical protein SAMN04487936_10984 [Halobacillus dabanensis]